MAFCNGILKYGFGFGNNNVSIGVDQPCLCNVHTMIIYSYKICQIDTLHRPELVDGFSHRISMPSSSKIHVMTISYQEVRSLKSVLASRRIAAAFASGYGAVRGDRLGLK